MTKTVVNLMYNAPGARITDAIVRPLALTISCVCLFSSKVRAQRRCSLTAKAFDTVTMESGFHQAGIVSGGETLSKQLNIYTLTSAKQ